MEATAERIRCTAEHLDKAAKVDADKPPARHNPWATVLPAAPQEPVRGVRDIVGTPF